MRAYKNTMTDLVEELKKYPQTPGVRIMVAEARQGEYHDYKNTKYVCGKQALVERLRIEGMQELAGRVIGGEFDEEADAEDEAALKKVCPPNLWPMMGFEK